MTMSPTLNLCFTASSLRAKVFRRRGALQRPSQPQRLDQASILVLWIADSPVNGKGAHALGRERLEQRQQLILLRRFLAKPRSIVGRTDDSRHAIVDRRGQLVELGHFVVRRVAPPLPQAGTHGSYLPGLIDSASGG